MNNLSWLLYAADVIPKLGNMLSGLTLISFLLVAGLIITSLINISEAKNRIRYDANRTKQWHPEAKQQLVMWRGILRKSVYIGVPTVFLIALVAIAAPSSKTIYMIAGSEAGETVVTSEQGQAVLSDVQEIIKLQLEGMKQ